MDWYPVETLPETGIFILVRNTEGEYAVLNKPPGCALGNWQKKGKEWVGAFVPFTPTHWTELDKSESTTTNEII